MAMNSLQKALVNAGLAEEPKERPHRGKKFKCRRCQSPMIKIPETNVMACSNEKCSQYFIFDKVM